jgi:hypothetical protein
MKIEELVNLEPIEIQSLMEIKGKGESEVMDCGSYACNSVACSSNSCSGITCKSSGCSGSSCKSNS